MTAGADRGGFLRWQASRSLGSDPTAAASEWLGFAPNSGYVGAALEGQAGYLRQYAGGTIFVDEFADLSPAVQLLLLDATEGQDASPLGAAGEPFRPDVRLVFATNKDVKVTIREDLLERVGRTIRVPALAERVEDLFPLVRHSLKNTPYRLDFRTWRLLLLHPWPGNVRELRRVVDGAVDRANARRHDPASGDGPGDQQPPEPPARTGGRAGRKTPLPFELFAGQEAFRGTPAGDPDERAAEQEVIGRLVEILKGRGYAAGQSDRPLYAEVASLLDVTESWLSRHRTPGRRSPGRRARTPSGGTAGRPAASEPPAAAEPAGDGQKTGPPLWPADRNEAPSLPPADAPDPPPK